MIKLDVVEAELLGGDGGWQVEAERGDVGDHVLHALFKGHADAGLAKLHAAHQEFHAEQGLPTAGTATDQRWPPRRQATQRDLVQSLDARRGLGYSPPPVCCLSCISTILWRTLWPS